MKAAKENETSFLQEVWSFVKVFLITAAVVLLFLKFVAHNVTVVGRSMQPTLMDGEYGFTSIISTYSDTWNRGDVVVLEMDSEGQKAYWVKRIIGLPGESIEAKDGKIYINGNELEEPWLSQDYIQECIDQYGYFQQDFDRILLADNEYFVLGDNRPVSRDSRDPEVGPVHSEVFFGKHVVVLFPFSKMGIH